MNHAKTLSPLLEKIGSDRLYSSSVLAAARHFWRTHEGSRVLDLADALQKRPEIEVIGVIDDSEKVVGIVPRERLFALIGKPFGREVLQRSLTKEIAESAMSFHAHADLYAVAQELRARERGTNKNKDDKVEGSGFDGRPAASGYFPLVDDDGKLRGILSRQDLANHLAEITENDIALAGRLQERLLSGIELPRAPGYLLKAWSRSAKGVGGDFYFGREISGGRIFAALCDVSGKGVAASLIVSMVWGILRNYDFRRGLGEFLVSLNKAIVATFQLEKYLTGFFMIYDGETKKLVYADMGHSHVMLVRDGRALAMRSEAMNFPVGIEPEIRPAINMVQLRVGDILFTYSDGIVEQQNPEGTEFGEARLGRTILSLGRGMREGDPAAALPLAIDAFRAGTPQQDDMSFLLLEVEGDGEPIGGRA